MDLSKDSIGEVIKNARKVKKLTQEQLAQKVGKKRAYIARIENEKGNNIRVKTLIDIIEKGLDGKIKIEFKNE